MQANCPQCAQPIEIDDARVPDKPFGVKCPKCQAVVRLPGRAPKAGPDPQATTPAPLPPAPPPVTAPALSQAAAEERPAAPGEAASAGRGRRALVALPDRGQAGGVAQLLARAGYAVDTLDDWEEGGRLLEQGLYDLAATARVAGAGGRESLYQRINRLNPDARRRLVVLLVGDEFKSGDGTQAFVCLADLVLHTSEAAGADALLRATMGERQRLYKAFNDAQARVERIED